MTLRPLTMEDRGPTLEVVPATSRRFSGRVLPDAAICRAHANGLADYVNCLVDFPFGCPHVLSFGFGFLCRHPDRLEIVRRTSPLGS